MSKPKTKSIQYFKYGIIACTIAAGFTGIACYSILKAAKQEIVIPTVSPTAGPMSNGKISKGDIITAKDIELKSIGKYGVADTIVKDPNTLVGTYALRDFKSEEYFWTHSVAKNYPKSLSEKVRYGAVAVPVSLISSVNADIQEDDFVKVNIIVSTDNKDENKYETTDVTGKLPDSGVTIIEADELKAMRVVGFYDSSGLDITYKKDQINKAKQGESVSSVSPGFIVFDANPIQQALLLQGMYGGSIQLIILPDEQQLEHKRSWGLIDENGNVVEDPIFEDDSDAIAQRQEELKNMNEQQKAEVNEEIDTMINDVESGSKVSFEENENGITELPMPQ